MNYLAAERQGVPNLTGVSYISVSPIATLRCATSTADGCCVLVLSTSG